MKNNPSTHVVHTSVGECDCEVTYTYLPATSGARESFQGMRGAGVQLEPDEPACIEIDSITTTDDITNLVPDRILDALRRRIMEGDA